VTNVDDLQTRLGYHFKDQHLLRLALTHPSVAHEQGVSIQHNQRLEFLGDAVLQLVLTHELYDKFPGVGEGPLTKARAQMVNRHTLAEQGRRLAKRLFKVKAQLNQNGQRAFVYEHAKSGDLFTIPDPNLQLDQLEEVQRDVGQLLEHGLPATDAAAPVSQPAQPSAQDTVPGAEPVPPVALPSLPPTAPDATATEAIPDPRD
jgi:Ribonuclease-III-like